MGRIKSLALAFISSLALAPTSWAADPAWPRVDKGLEVREFFSTWYLRGDIGYRFNEISGGSIRGTALASSTINDSTPIGIGVGLNWNWLRADLTFDYGLAPPFVGSAPAMPVVTAKLGAYTALVNAYLDLGRWWGLTPYVGAGIGTSYIRPTHFDPLVSALWTSIGQAGTWDFSWAVMAGLSYALSPNFIVDAGYRYLDIGRPDTSLNPTGTVSYGDLWAQEVRIGLRYLID